MILSVACEILTFMVSYEVCSMGSKSDLILILPQYNVVNNFFYYTILSWGNVCCDPSLFIVAWAIISYTKVGHYTLEDPSMSKDNPMTHHHTAQLTTKYQPLWPYRFKDDW